jgi:hypothetical protein
MGVNTNLERRDLKGFEKGEYPKESYWNCSHKREGVKI